MRQTVSLLQYSFSEGELLTALTPNIKVLEPDLNLAFAVAKLLSVQARVRTNEDWKEVRFIDDVLCKEFSRHVALHSFMYDEQLLCVPTPGLRVNHQRLDFDLDETELRARYALAEQFNCIAYGLEGRLSDFPGSLHVDPDYLMISFRDYEPFISFGEALYYGFFCGPSEKWNYYTVPEIPSNIKLSSVKGIMLSGGKYTAAARETVEWMPQVKQFLRRIYAEFPHIKLFGHCLGAQVLAASLGGVVDKDPEHLFIAGIETVRLTSAGFEEVKGLPQEFGICEMHRDYIQALPPDGVLYGSSESCPVEAWGIPGRVIGLQGHIEFTLYFLQHWIIEDSYKAGDITREVAETAMIQAKQYSDFDSSIVKALYSWFKANSLL
jgi:GMP synthase-like glutamine amidotransferase